MSNKNRVNPDHYKLAGRDPQGETFTPERNREAFGRAVARQRDGRGSRANYIPGAPPVGGSPAPKGISRRSNGMGMQLSDKRGVKSTSAKQGTSRHGIAPSPQTAPVAGAFGRETERPRTAKRKPTARGASARATGRRTGGGPTTSRRNAKTR
jgi:hypothetical protein